MDNFSTTSILSKSRMQQDTVDMTQESNSASISVIKTIGSPGRKPKAPKVVDIPVLELQDSAACMTDEPLLIANPRRHVLFPIEHPDVMSMAKKAIAVFWTPEEIDLTKDMRDWEKLDANTQHFIKHVLGFFAASDGILMENLALNFQHEVQ